MFARILGVQDVDFVSDDNNHIVGKNLYCSFKNNYVDGLKTNKYFASINLDSYDDLVPDVDVIIDFNEKGKIDNISIQ